METIVITTVNTNAKIEYQKACFNKWKKIGYDVKTFNCSKERAVLLKNGFNDSDIVELTEAETAIGLFRKAIPRILPILNRVRSYNVENVILVNSDIYPAHRKPPTTYLSSLADIIALTRNDCIEIGNTRFTDSNPYRGGLDIFFFTSIGIKQIFQSLVRRPVAERMTFGIPGWDYYLGHQIAHCHNGLIMDGEVFLHPYHKPSYNQIDECAEYAKEIYKSGIYTTSEPNQFAHEFSVYINDQCLKNTRLSRLLKLMYFTNIALPFESKSILDSVLLIHSTFEEILSEYYVKVPYEITSLRVFIVTQLKITNWSAAEFYRKKELNNVPLINSYLLLLLLLLIIKKHTNKLNISYRYPENNAHGAALRQIIENTTEDVRVVDILRLFSSELIDYSIININLFKFISLSCNTNTSLNLCLAIYSFLKKI